MGRVKIKHPRPKEIGTRRQLLGILAMEVRVTRLIPSWNGVIMLTVTEQDAEAMFTVKNE